ncbi:hypothetical protein ACJMK2_017245 [Sinanodonta woodiana]|uniref:UspA domain-containing protein n=1 Tax=Sinanodonta woodiana TaxID=1069815 RepID=A0ABD3UZM6_SINWO
MAGSERKILIAVDGSEQAMRAFDWYYENIYKPGDYCMALYVTQLTLRRGSGILTDPDAIVKDLKQTKQAGDTIMSSFAEKIREKGIKGNADTVACGDSSPGEKIVKTAEFNKANIIVMGTRGLGKIRRTILGSVSSYVLHHAHCPVIIIK